MTENQFTNKCFSTLMLVMCGFISFKYLPLLDPPSQMLPATVQNQVKTAAEKTKRILFDINGDHLINCIDYATIFCIAYPGSIIIENRNPSTGMNHLFNAISVDGIWLYIEPQSGKTMVEAWGNKYNSYYNVNKTAYYLSSYSEDQREAILNRTSVAVNYNTAQKFQKEKLGKNIAVLLILVACFFFLNASGTLDISL